MKESGTQYTPVVVDAFIDEPRTILECTSFVEQNELSKLEKFVETKKLAASTSSNGQCKAYFFTYSIHSDIREKTLKLLKENEIVLVDACYSI